MKDLLKNGNIEIWDITLTNLAINAVSKEIVKLGGKIDKNEEKIINELRETRNEIHHGQSELSDDEFAKYWQRLEDILITFGDYVEEINIFKEHLSEIGQTKFVEINPKTKFIQLKDNANKLFKEEKY
uniref:DZIP3-like HEPN domain-containing protein n=1 Tax=Panagrolaimus sp. ES5 TaxID=591445 RepID=A0AC34F8E5_9BILA